MIPAMSGAATAATAMRESFRDWYAATRDPIPQQRLMWRAQLFRQLVHLLPGDRVLELGAGNGDFTKCLAAASRGANEIVSIHFDDKNHVALKNESFDFVVLLDVLDAANA